MPVSAVLLCVVVGISDGDTMTARCDIPDGATTVRVRLAEIDAPEKAQAFGARSKQNLSELCFGKHAVVTTSGRDRYKRVLAHVECDGVKANAEQVRAGMAWVFDRYVVDSGLYKLQAEAQMAKRGLWIDWEPVAPWEWRSDRRQATSGS